MAAAPPSPSASTPTKAPPKAAPSPTSRPAEAGREKTLKRDKSNFQELHGRASKRMVAGPYRLRSPAKISTKTIDTDTIGRVNKANQKMSQFLYNLANEPSVGLFHVNDHIRRAVPRLVTVRQETLHQKAELDKSSCDVDDLLPEVRTIANLQAFKRINALLNKTLPLATPRPANRSLGPPTPSRSSASNSPHASLGKIDLVAPSTPSKISPSPSSDTLAAPSALDLEPKSEPQQQVQPQPQPAPEATITVPTTESAAPPSDEPTASTSSEMPNADVLHDSSEPKLSHEEMILGARTVGSAKKKKRSDSGSRDSDALVPKNF